MSSSRARSCPFNGVWVCAHQLLCTPISWLQYPLGAVTSGASHLVDGWLQKQLLPTREAPCRWWSQKLLTCMPLGILQQRCALGSILSRDRRTKLSYSLTLAMVFRTPARAFRTLTAVSQPPLKSMVPGVHTTTSEAGNKPVRPHPHHHFQH